MLNYLFSAILTLVFAGTALAADVLKLGALPAADSIILYAAKENGTFAKHGLDVQVIPFQSALELGAAMRAGSLDGHFGDIINVLLQNETGAPQVIVATTSHSRPDARYFGLAVSPRSKVTSLEELKGKPCSIGRATIVEFVLDELLAREQAAGSLEKHDIRQIPVRLQMLLSGQMESALLPEPLLSLVEGAGSRVLLDDRDLNVALAVIALRRPEHMDASFHDKVTRFRTALQEEAQRINADPETYKAMMQKLKLLSPKAAPHYTMLRFDDPANLPSEEDIRRYTAWMKSGRMLRKDAPALADIVFKGGE